MNLDPRKEVIADRFSSIRKVIPVVSGKGGVGKTLVSTVTALALRKHGYSVGLLDLDFSGASTHIVLGYTPRELPEEEKGIVPPVVNGIKFMSIAYYSEDNPLPLRGNEASDALIELLAITKWGKLDYLIIDMPPGMGDQVLDVMRFIDSGEYVVVSTPSALSINVVSRLLRLLGEGGYNVLGLVENMARVPSNDRIRVLAEELNVPYLGKIMYDETVEDAIGEPGRLLETSFGNDVISIVKGFIA